jgi:tetratricopeptide (TPR) repeat protein
MRRFLPVLLWGAALGSPATADEVELTSGAVIEGKVEDLGDSIRISRSIGSVTYPKSMVRKITPKKTPEELYEERSKSLKEDDVPGRLDLARWCLKQKLTREAVQEYRKVIAADPDHEEARLGAGFQKVDDRWMTDEEANAARGLVKHRGRWMSPEQRDLDLALEEQKELDQALTKEVQLRLTHLKSTNEKKRQEALEALARIEDKFKAKAYLGAIASPQRELRKFIFQELGRMKVLQAARPLVRRSLWDEDADLRPVALAAARELGHPDIALLYLPFLGEESVSARIRAVEALAEFRDPRTAPALVQALENNLALQRMYDSMGREMTTVTLGTVVVPGGGAVTLPRVARVKYDPLDKESRVKLEHERGLLANTLATLTGERHGTDPARWRAWIERKKNAQE